MGGLILVDSSVLIDHIRSPEPLLSDLLTTGRVLIHPYVFGEVALGQFVGRSGILWNLSRLQKAPVAQPRDVLAFIEANSLFGIGIGYVDAHLLVSAKLSRGTQLWSRDKRLASAAHRLRLAMNMN